MMKNAERTASRKTCRLAFT